MVHDVAVAQAMYGADMTTRTGNSTYGFNSTADVTNQAMKFNAGEMFTIFTIWDAGGNDTLDLSGYYTPSVIDLREGAYSSAGGAGAYSAALAGTQLSLTQINANNAAAGLGPRSATLYDYYFNGVEGVNEGLSWKQITGTGSQFLMEQNIGIAYGAIIENAIGGHGNDRINGNQANNRFTGNAGADTFVFARYGADDTSIDTITDFATGVDKIDLTEFASVDAADVTYSGGHLRIDTDNNGVADFHINLLGAAVNTTSDIIYAG
jgi:Ca2+-binding RTX toxin-like protein